MSSRRASSGDGVPSGRTPAPSTRATGRAGAAAADERWPPVDATSQANGASTSSGLSPNAPIHNLRRRSRASTSLGRSEPLRWFHRTDTESVSGRRGRERPVLRVRVESGVAELRGDRDRPRGWTLLLDGTPQSHVDLDDPTHVEFEYVRRFTHVVDTALPPRRPMRVLHLGGGGMTLVRYIAATRPRSDQHVVEIDRRLVDLVRRELPFERTWRVKIRT